MLMGSSLYFLFSDMLVGNHYLCDGMVLKEKEPIGFSLRYDSETHLIHLNGSLEIGVESAFSRLLKKHPEATGVVLESIGGNVYQGRGLANTIINNHLNTYSFNNCYSACTIAYLAGQQRFLGPDAGLGLHSYHIEPNTMASGVDVSKEQSKDLSFFQKRIPDRAFVEKIFGTECPEIWIPSLAELLTAGVVHQRLSKEHAEAMKLSH